MSELKYFHFTIEGSKTEMIASIDQNNIVTVISYFNGFKNDSSYDFAERKESGYEKGLLKHHEFSMADVLIPHLLRIGKDIEKIEPHDLLTVIEYRSKLKENKLLENVDSKDENNSEKEISIERSDEIVILPEFYFFSKSKHCFHPSFPSPFVYKEKSFSSVSQFIAYSKAMISGDDDAAFKILDLNNTNMLAKTLVNGEIKGFDISRDKELFIRWRQFDHAINEIVKSVNVNLLEWEEKRVSIMSVANREKIKQNEDINKTLIDTKEQKIIFATTNAILGCGIEEKDITQDSLWTGVNELGKILNSLK